MDSAGNDWYFTTSDLRAAFNLAVSSERAAVLAEVWSREFASCIEDGKVVELPESFELPRLGRGGQSTNCHPRGPHDDAEFMNENNSLLLRFSPITLSLVAASSKEVRARFDRLGVEYASASIDSPDEWRGLLRQIRKGNPPP